jgi:prophage regulatory protein
MRVMRLKEVVDTTGLSRSTVYKYISEGVFPTSVTLGERCVGWVDSEVHEWIVARIKERDNASVNGRPDRKTQADSPVAADTNVHLACCVGCPNRTASPLQSTRRLISVSNISSE